MESLEQFEITGERSCLRRKEAKPGNCSSPQRGGRGAVQNREAIHGSMARNKQPRGRNY